MVLVTEKESLPHACGDIVKSAWRAVEVRIKWGRVRPEAVADGGCPVEQLRSPLLSILVAGLLRLAHSLLPSGAGGSLTSARRR